MSGGCESILGMSCRSSGLLALNSLTSWRFLGLSQTLVPGETLGDHFSRISNFEVRTEWRPAAEIPGDPLGALLRSLLGRCWEHLLLGETLADQILKV